MGVHEFIAFENSFSLRNSAWEFLSMRVLTAIDEIKRRESSGPVRRHKMERLWRRYRYVLHMQTAWRAGISCKLPGAHSIEQRLADIRWKLPERDQLRPVFVENQFGQKWPIWRLVA